MKVPPLRAHIFFAAAATLALAACSQTGGDTPPSSASPTTPPPVTPSPGQTCDTSIIDKIGEPVTSAGVPNNRNYRIVRPNQVITQDFVETRTNVDVDDEGLINSVYCG